MTRPSLIVAHLEGNVEGFNDFWEGCDWDSVVIGGIALRFHLQALNSNPINETKDADIVCGLNSFQYLQITHIVTKNRVMNKREYKASLADNSACDVDVYLNHEADLNVPIQEIIENAITHNGLLYAHPVHLLALKIDNYIGMDAAERASTRLGKVTQDILTLLGIVQFDECSCALIKGNFFGENKRLELLEQIIGNHSDLCEQVCKHLCVPDFEEPVSSISACA